MLCGECRSNPLFLQCSRLTEVYSEAVNYTDGFGGFRNVGVVSM